jgi:hypothetical protein
MNCQTISAMRYQHSSAKLLFHYDVPSLNNSLNLKLPASSRQEHYLQWDQPASPAHAKILPMTNWQNMVRESIASLATGEGADYGYAYVERLNTSTYKIQTSRPLEEIECEFDAAVKRVIEIASKETSSESLTFAGEFAIPASPSLKYKTA